MNGTDFRMPCRYIAAAGVLLIGAGAASAQAVPTLDWQPCGRDPAYECANPRVPLDYDDPQGPTTRIALARVPASDSGHRIRTLVLNPGGPGGSGVGLIFSGYGDYMSRRLRGRFDIVGFDPRMLRRIKLWSQPQHGFWQSILELARERGRNEVAGEVQRLVDDYRRREWLRRLYARFLGSLLLKLKWRLAPRDPGRRR